MDNFYKRVIEKTAVELARVKPKRESPLLEVKDERVIPKLRIKGNWRKVKRYEARRKSR